MTRSMSSYFIDRPVLAWVIALIVMLSGVVSITRLPISEYPKIAPPQVSINANYPGASAAVAEQSVAQIIEQHLTGLDGLLYMSTSTSNDGSASINLTFASGTDADVAQVQVQNRLQEATPLLPQVVQQQGISVRKNTSSFIMAIGVTSEDGSMSTSDLADYLAANVVDRLSRVDGVGSANVFGGQYAMRIWLDPDKLNHFQMTPEDIVQAIQAQNAQVSVGQLGDYPAVRGQEINATVTAQGRLHTPEQFRNIVVRGGGTGSVLRLGDVARVELGSSTYGFDLTLDGKDASGLGVQLAIGANALKTVDGVKAALAAMQPNFPHGMKVTYAFDVTPFILKSIEEVIKTLLIAIVLVFLVMLLFLQNIRATLIPTIAVPVVLLGTFCVLRLFGYSINMLTMFALVLAIGLLVDDAIVVVENVERLMSEEGLSPLEATRKSMNQITGALIGIATALSAVFIPMAFLPGSSGVIYRQFSVTIVSAMVLSVLVAIVLTPALCATLLKPIARGEHHGHAAFFQWFNAFFERAQRRYRDIVGRIVHRPLAYLPIYLIIVAGMGLLFVRLPTAYLPDEDQAVLISQVRGPPGLTLPHTVDALRQMREYFMKQEASGVLRVFTVAGFNFGSNGQNVGMAFIRLKDWSERDSSESANAIQRRASLPLSQIKEAQVFAFAPPPILELGISTGFDFYLRDDNGQGHDALMAARNQLVAMASNDKLLTNMRPGSLDDGPQLHLDIDAAQAAAVGVSLADVNDTLSLAWGGRYIDDFIDRGRVKRVIVQADAPYRMVPEDLGRWYVRNAQSQMVSLSAFARAKWVYGPPELERFNGTPAMEISGQPVEGVSSGEAMKEIERLVAKLPAGFSVDWTGESYQERTAGSQIPLLYTLSIIVVFLCLAALYESWSIPTAILFAVPLGVVGAVVASTLRGFERDMYFQVAMLTTIGLACKNAILIVEFAKEYVEAGAGLIEATLHAVHDRLRPILMTSMAFGLGVLPLAIATGAGAGAQRAIGTGVFGGMLAGTFFGIFFVPLFFVLIQGWFHGVHAKVPSATADAAPPSEAP